MESFKNSIQLVGNIGLDPEIKVFDSGKKMARFSLATSDTFKNKNGDYEKTTQWHTIVVWGPLAERVEKKFKKGSGVAVRGKLTYRTYETKQGEKRHLAEINASQLTGIGFV